MALPLAACCQCGASCTDDIDKPLDRQFCGWDHCVTAKMLALTTY